MFHNIIWRAQGQNAGSVVALDELNCSEFPGETLALKETWGLDRYRLTRSQFLPDRCYLTID